jgi:hypothetical protein
MRSKDVTLARLDQRTGLARRIAEVARRLSDDLKPRQRLTVPEKDQLARCAQQLVLAEVATRRALIGEIAVEAAVRASTAAQRAERQLRRAITLEDTYP